MLLLQLRKHSSLCDSGVRGEIILVTKKYTKPPRKREKEIKRERERGNEISKMAHGQKNRNRMFDKIYNPRLLIQI